VQDNNLGDTTSAREYCKSKKKAISRKIKAEQSLT